MIRVTVALVALLGVAACGGGSRYSSDNASGGFGGLRTAPAGLPFASGPIQRACMADGRRAASRARCGCVQAVADQSLSASDQRRGAGYFNDPHALQQVRQSDNASNERFWKTWKAYGQEAAAICANS